MPTTEEIQRKQLAFQKNEITEYHIYMRLARMAKSPENTRVLEKIAGEELDHYRYWQAHTGQEVQPYQRKVWKYILISRVLGFTFGVKLMERGEEEAQRHYASISERVPGVEALIQAENDHENAVLDLLDEESLRYTGSIVLGLNDGLVELSGALAGFTLAFQDTKLVALTGSITGIAGALSMGASEYLSTQSEGTTKSPMRASLYTTSAYVATVLVLILPYLVLGDPYFSLACTLAIAILIIASFNYYIAVAKGMPFGRRFVEMAGLSLGVAAITFLVGYLMRSFLGVDV
jgi:VIT1/CCC1 family predicted Fe2+/Mn2+ transporter